MRSLLPLLLCWASALPIAGQDPGAIAPIERRLPPTGGIELVPEVREALRARTDELADRVWEIDFKEHAADAGMLVKAVDFALVHGEFYDEKHVELAEEMLDLAEERARLIDEEDSAPWTKERGLVIRGFRSAVDESYQPYGLEIPEALDLTKPVPLLVWLHGRGDKTTDLHFLAACGRKSQAFGGFVADQGDAIILHPFGRQCVGWKHAGETDVFEAIAAVMEDYPIDPDRVALAGFSMGGAGAWHIGAHYRDRFCAVHAGAGFAETKEYNSIKPEDYPAEYVQTLWQVYDVPNYVRNFLNGPVLAYSGSEDKQKQAADLMERELAKVGHELRHVIGEGMGHKYNEESVAEIWNWLKEAWVAGRSLRPDSVQWQTPTLRYPGYSWLQLTGLTEHWAPAIAKAEWSDDTVEVELENVSAFRIATSTADLSKVRVVVDGQELAPADPGFTVEALSLVRENDHWTWGEPGKSRKRPGIQGPIDDAYLTRFVVVPPDRPPVAPAFARWLDFELDHFRARWKALMRGEFLEKRSDELDSEDIADANLILWGDPDSNPMLAEIVDRLPIEWEGTRFVFRGQEGDTAAEVPVFVFPNPLNPDRYVVINSGLTFREDHDKTNSQQNPKLPDWAIIGLDVDPDGSAPGRIAKAGFFDEEWK